MGLGGVSQKRENERERRFIDEPKVIYLMTPFPSPMPFCGRLNPRRGRLRLFLLAGCVSDLRNGFDTRLLFQPPLNGRTLEVWNFCDNRVGASDHWHDDLAICESFPGFSADFHSSSSVEVADLNGVPAGTAVHQRGPPPCQRQHVLGWFSIGGAGDESLLQSWLDQRLCASLRLSGTRGCEDANEFTYTHFYFPLSHRKVKSLLKYKILCLKVLRNLPNDGEDHFEPSLDLKWKTFEGFMPQFSVMLINKARRRSFEVPFNLLDLSSYSNVKWHLQKIREMENNLNLKLKVPGSWDLCFVASNVLSTSDQLRTQLSLQGTAARTWRSH